MRSCDRASKSSASVLRPSSVSKLYTFSTATHGSSCRCFANSSSTEPSSCSRSSSSLRAADHSSRVPTLCLGIRLPSLPRCLSLRPAGAPKLIVGRTYSLDALGGDEHHAVVVGEDDVGAERARRTGYTHPPRAAWRSATVGTPP